MGTATWLPGAARNTPGPARLYRLDPPLASPVGVQVEHVLVMIVSDFGGPQVLVVGAYAAGMPLSMQPMPGTGALHFAPKSEDEKNGAYWYALLAAGYSEVISTPEAVAEHTAGVVPVPHSGDQTTEPEPSEPVEADTAAEPDPGEAATRAGLEQMTVRVLRETAAGQDPPIEGASRMRRTELIDALTARLNV